MNKYKVGDVLIFGTESFSDKEPHYMWSHRKLVVLEESERVETDYLAKIRVRNIEDDDHRSFELKLFHRCDSMRIFTSFTEVLKLRREQTLKLIAERQDSLDQARDLYEKLNNMIRQPMKEEQK